ncbi:hypothetical protein LSAT2_025317 [Lamellibrachia satsuma]|nr:hypothetical protein LSAT2_025317 [Lamellibrachia satsuma]
MVHAITKSSFSTLLLAKYIKKLVGAVAEERPTAAQILQEELFCSKDQIIANLRCKVTSQDEQIKLLQARISQLEQRLSEKEKQQSSQETTNTSA